MVILYIAVQDMTCATSAGFMLNAGHYPARFLVNMGIERLKVARYEDILERLDKVEADIRELRSFHSNNTIERQRQKLVQMLSDIKVYRFGGVTVDSPGWAYVEVLEKELQPGIELIKGLGFKARWVTHAVRSDVALIEVELPEDF